jgi:hypothetical protein
MILLLGGGFGAGAWLLNNVLSAIRKPKELFLGYLITSITATIIAPILVKLVLCQEKVQIKMSKLFLNISMYHKLVQIIAAFAFILFYPTSFAAFCKYCVSYWLGDL